MDTEFALGTYGLRAVLHSPWSVDVEREIKDRGVMELNLNVAKGWLASDVSFLTRFPELRSLEILHFGLPGVEPIHELHHLRHLQVDTYCDTPIRFAEFPYLEDCSLEWRKSVGLFECTTLKRLFINRYNGKDPEPFGNLVNLEWLGLLSTPMRSLDGFNRLSNLGYLRIALWRQLADLSGISGLRRLKTLWMDTCRSVGTIEAVAAITSLTDLVFDNFNMVESLAPIAGLSSLDACFFLQSTNIADGDMNPLLKLPSLTEVSFENRRHYTHTRDQVRAILRDRLASTRSRVR